MDSVPVTRLNWCALKITRAFGHVQLSA